MNRLVIYFMLLVLLALLLVACGSAKPDVVMEQYNKDNSECQIADIDYQDCMRERGWMHDDHWLGAPKSNPYQNQIPHKN